MKHKLLKKHNLIRLKILNLLGLILITGGSLFLAFNTDKIVEVNTTIMDHIQKAYGYVSMEPMSDIDRNNFIKVIKSAKAKNLIGYVLFSIGFGLQVIVAFLDLKTERGKLLKNKG